jgi:hypothetical protein
LGRQRKRTAPGRRSTKVYHASGRRFGAAKKRESASILATVSKSWRDWEKLLDNFSRIRKMVAVLWPTCAGGLTRSLVGVTVRGVERRARSIAPAGGHGWLAQRCLPHCWTRRQWHTRVCVGANDRLGESAGGGDCRKQQSTAEVVAGRAPPCFVCGQKSTSSSRPELTRLPPGLVFPATVRRFAAGPGIGHCSRLRLCNKEKRKQGKEGNRSLRFLFSVFPFSHLPFLHTNCIRLKSCHFLYSACLLV